MLLGLHHALARGYPVCGAHHTPKRRCSIALLAHIVAAVAIGLAGRPASVLLLILIAWHLLLILMLLVHIAFKK